VTGHVTDQIMLYLDEELQGEKRYAVEAHVAACAECRAALERERALVTAIEQARPLYRASEELHARIAQALRQTSAVASEVQSTPRLARLRFRAWIAVAAVILVALGAPLAWYLTRQSGARPPGPSELALLAAEMHQRSVRGQLPLEIQSHSPEEISRWFTHKVPFDVKLPDDPWRPDQSKPYELQGARLISFKQDCAAYISYNVRQHPVSLVITSATIAHAAGCDEIDWQGLRFHVEVIGGWKVLTWSDHGLTYALVSDFEERGQGACIVCHSGPGDERLWEGLKQK